MDHLAVATKARPRSIWLLIASKLLSVWTALMLVELIVVATAMLVIHTAAPSALPAGVLVALLCIVSAVSAFGIRRATRPYNFGAMLSAIAWVVLLAFWNVRVSLFGELLNLAVLVIVLEQRRRFV
jgi:hypothetical protein